MTVKTATKAVELPTAWRSWARNAMILNEVTARADGGLLARTHRRLAANTNHPSAG